MTPEHIYELYHRYAILKTKGVVPRPVSDFSRIKASGDWIHLERAARVLSNSNGNVDPELFIETLVNFYKGFFPLERLTHITSFKIYSTKVELINSAHDIADVKRLISANVDFVVKFCVETGIFDLDGYLRHDIDLIPSMAVHLGSGRISVYFLACVNDLMRVVSEYPPDVVEEYLRDFLTKREGLRRSVLFDGSIRKFSDNMEKVIAHKIKQRRDGTNGHGKTVREDAGERAQPA